MDLRHKDEIYDPRLASHGHGDKDKVSIDDDDDAVDGDDGDDGDDYGNHLWCRWLTLESTSQSSTSL